MQLKRHLLLMVGILVVLQELVAIGAIGLFSRMAPTIAGAIQKNEGSIEVAEDMLFILAASAGRSVEVEGRRRFVKALHLLRAKLLAEQERPVLLRLDRLSSMALAGGEVARQQVLTDLRELIAINRHAIKSVEMEAQRLSAAGVWGAVFLGFFSFIVALIVLRRLDAHLVAPLLELLDVLHAVQAGDSYRRCQTRVVPPDVRRALELVNALLDRHAAPDALDPHHGISSQSFT